jgi:hypothetical protein
MPDLPEKVIRPRRRAPNRRNEVNRCCLNRLLDSTLGYLLKAGALCRGVQYRGRLENETESAHLQSYRLLLNRMNLSCDQKILGMIYVFPSQPFFDLKSRRYSSIKNCASCSEISPVVRADAIVLPRFAARSLSCSPSPPVEKSLVSTTRMSESQVSPDPLLRQSSVDAVHACWF